MSGCFTQLRTTLARHIVIAEMSYLRDHRHAEKSTATALNICNNSLELRTIGSQLGVSTSYGQVRKDLSTVCKVDHSFAHLRGSPWIRILSLHTLWPGSLIHLCLLEEC
jgi:hypothetical protein